MDDALAQAITAEPARLARAAVQLLKVLCRVHVPQLLQGGLCRPHQLQQVQRATLSSSRQLRNHEWG